MENKILVPYSTCTGSRKKIAENIGMTLPEMGEKRDDKLAPSQLTTQNLYIQEYHQVDNLKLCKLNLESIA